MIPSKENIGNLGHKSSGLKRLLGRLLLLWVLMAAPLAPSLLFARSQSSGAVATQHPLATQTAAKILQEGGNAIDAAVAAAFTLAVVEPYNSGLGAGGMALVWDPVRKGAFALDFRERAPLAATPAMYHQPVAQDASRDGPLAIAVPGELAGLLALHRRWGTMPWKKLLRDAIDYAEGGFPPDDPLLKKIQLRRKCLSRDYDTYKVYRRFFQKEEEHPGATPSPLIQTHLANTLREIQKNRGETFYRGSLARKLIANLQGKGALLTRFDLERYQAKERAALVARFPFGKVWGMPLPSSGGISVISGLNTMEALEKKSREPFQDHWVPWMVQVLERLFEMRNKQMGDSDYVSGIPERRWVNKSWAHQEAKKILSPSSANLGEDSEHSKTTVKEGIHTTHISIMDSKGFAVAMTLTLNLPFGSCVTAGTTGILMNDQMDDFSTAPGRPNAFGLVQSGANDIRGGKRPLSSMSPTLVTKKKIPILALGSPGGPQIITSVLQVLFRHFFLGESLGKAIQAPRFHYQGIPKKIFLERTEDTHWLRGLKKMGLPLQYQSLRGNVQAVAYDPHTETFSAFSDPRGTGLAEVVGK